jgi:hypothetical protein
MLAPRPFTHSATTLDHWNTICSDDLDVGPRGLFFREHPDFYAAPIGGCRQSLQLDISLSPDQSKIERLRADTSGSAIVSLASALPKHPILQFRPIIMRIGRLQYFSQSSIPSPCLFI